MKKKREFNTISKRFYYFHFSKQSRNIRIRWNVTYLIFFVSCFRRYYSKDFKDLFQFIFEWKAWKQGKKTYTHTHTSHTVLMAKMKLLYTDAWIRCQCFCHCGVVKKLLNMFYNLEMIFVFFFIYFCKCQWQMHAHTHTHTFCSLIWWCFFCCCWCCLWVSDWFWLLFGGI